MRWRSSEYMETHTERSALEKEYKDSIRNYRSIIRKGFDETLKKPGEVAQDLISETRVLLDKNSTAVAKQTLNRLASHLKMMKTSFPKANTHLGNELKATIDFVNQIVNTPNQSSASDRQIDMHMEKARFALQNEDWSATRKYTDIVIDRYLVKQQNKLLPGSQTSSAPGGSEALERLVQGGASCRTIQLKDILGSEKALSELFSSLSKTTFTLDSNNKDDQNNCVVLRQGIDRKNTIYIIGIPIHSSISPYSLRNTVRNFSSTLISPDDCSLTRSTLEKLLLTCLQNMTTEQLFVSEGETLGSLSKSNIDTFRNLKGYAGEMNSENLVNWAKTALTQNH